jgi:hypothetical protein
MTNVPEGARSRAPETDARARALVHEAARHLEAALARIDRAVGALVDVRASGAALAVLSMAGAMLMVQEDELRRRLLGRPRLHDDVATAGSVR